MDSNKELNNNIKKLYSKVNNNYFVVFGLSTCIFCKNTLKLLKDNNIKYKYYLIDNFYNLFFKTFIDLSDKYPELNIDSTHKTVPVIFYNGKFIGGYTNLKQIIN